MANLRPTSVTDGERSHDDTDNDVSDAAVGFERNGGTGPLSIKAHRPLLFHKIQNQTSILALLISDSKIYAGTQSGDLLVCYHCEYLSSSIVLTSFRCGRWKHSSSFQVSMPTKAASFASICRQMERSFSPAQAMLLSMYEVHLHALGPAEG